MKGLMRIFGYAAVLLGLLIGFAGCGSSSEEEAVLEVKDKLGIEANMVFFYYRDLSKAVDFYSNILGLERVLDYGFAQAFRVSRSSFVCLVDENEGMHDAHEPKTVTLAFITAEVDGWYEYLNSQSVEMHSPLGDATRHPTRGFVALDPEGYYLEFETFLDHPQNTELLGRLSRIPAVYPRTESETSRPLDLGVKGTIFWLYYRDLEGAQKFYQGNLQRELLVDQGFARVLSSSSSGFIGLVDEAQGLHRFSEEKSVNIGFFISDIEQWYQDLVEKGLKMRGPLDEAEEGLVRAFVAFDPAGYYLEFDKFIPHEKNRVLLDILCSLE